MNTTQFLCIFNVITDTYNVISVYTRYLCNKAFNCVTGRNNFWYFMPDHTVPIPAAYFTFSRINQVQWVHDDVYNNLFSVLPETEQLRDDYEPYHLTSWLSANLSIQGTQYSMDEWIPNLAICPLVRNLYPTPAQLVACWSIQSFIWAPRLSANLIIIDNDGNEHSIPLYGEYDQRVWRRLITNGLEEEGQESESESETETVTEPESDTVTESVTESETETEPELEEFKNDDEEEVATVTAVEALMEKEEEFTQINTVEYESFVPVFGKNLNLNLP